ncbi:sensor histidine kinase [Luteimonas terricola]|uniref:histidine kinase n=1 Tax=Luteimonas terricola TaxID=645597 RepID=A0ABQ2EIN6_9GAMM|nr:HAMP domain-containing sensor histidine kinase [Luteimonas terricola]GGK12665.1 two-component sensor histidine kinase [Luteimonas terricola]
MSQAEGGAPAPAFPGRRRYRRRLRSRIILSFALLGLGLTAMFAIAAAFVGAVVEDQAVGSVLKENVDDYAQRFYEDRTAQWAPLGSVRAHVYGPGGRHNVPPEWAELDTGVYNITGEESGEPFVYRVVVKKDPDYWFFLAQDMTSTAEVRARIKLILIAAVVLFTLLAGVIGWWSAARVMRPVSELANLLGASGDKAGPGELAPHFPDDEVGELATALDDYAARLTEVVQRDREFNADVSHELRTPLAVVKGAVELLLSRPDLDEKTVARLQRIQRAEQQCTDLISALLLLSRAERGHGSTDVCRVAEQLLEAHRSQLGGKALELLLEGEAGTLVVDAPESAVSVALGNLIGNAVKYTTAGTVIVRLRERAVDVIDSGPGLSAEDAAHLFQRGYRGSHAEHTHGGGIGLSIVRRLCRLYDWQVRVVPGAERGVVATLRFDVDADEAG